MEHGDILLYRYVPGSHAKEKNNKNCASYNNQFLYTPHSRADAPVYADCRLDDKEIGDSMEENGISIEEQKTLLRGLYSAKILAEAEKMVRLNREREKELFTDYNPLTGEGAPGKRREIYIDDYYKYNKGSQAAILYLPVEMFSVGVIYRLAQCESIEEFCYREYGDYDDDIRNTVIEEFLREWAKYDFYFFCYAFARIKNKEGGDDIPFKLRPAQIKLTKHFEKDRLAGKPIRVILLKCRQWGGSTLTQIYMAWIQIMHVKSWNSIIVGHQGDSAAEVKDMYVKLITQLPDFLFYSLGEDYDESQPKIKGGGTSNISLIPPRNCKIKTATAVNPEGARGGDASMAHCTEVAFWPQTEQRDPQKQIKSSCSGVLMKANTMIVYESTPNGANFFKDEWDRANRYDDYGNKESAFDPIFVAWFEIEQYRMAVKNILEWACTLISRRYDAKNLWDYMYSLWEMGATLEGIYWYRQKMGEYKDLQDMQQEYPSNAIEAFKYSGTAEFDIYKIEKQRKFCRKPILQGEIYGKAPKGEQAMENLHLVRETAGALKIWDMPDTEHPYLNRYFVSVDIGGRYKTSDYSCITVLDRLDMMSEDGVLNEDAGPKVVAEWWGHTDADLLAIKCAQIAKFYCNALLIVENNTAYSKLNNVDTDNVSELFFPILLPLYDNLYSHNRSNLDKSGNNRETIWGWNTNRSTKVSIIKYLGQCIRDMLWIEREKEMLNECTYYMKFPNGKYGAIPGKHDDRVMSRAIGLYVSRFEWDRYSVKRKLTYEELTARKARLRKMSGGAEKIMQ